MKLTPEVEAYLSKARHALEVAWKLQAGGDSPVLMDLLDRFALSYQAVMTKADTLKPAALEANRKKFLEAIRKRPAAHPEILVTSSETGYGMSELRDTLAELAAQG